MENALPEQYGTIKDLKEKRSVKYASINDLINKENLLKSMERQICSLDIFLSK